MYIHLCIMYNIYIYTLYTSQGYYLNFLDIHKLFTVKEPLILLYLVIVIEYCNLDLFLKEVASNVFKGPLF